jgi:hypothetical protein
MISEIYVRREDLPHFMIDVRKMALKENCDIIFGTIRLIKKDQESFFGLGEGRLCVRHFQFESIPR